MLSFLILSLKNARTIRTIVGGYTIASIGLATFTSPDTPSVAAAVENKQTNSTTLS